MPRIFWATRRVPDWTCPPKRDRASAGLTAGSCGPFLFGCNSGCGAFLQRVFVHGAVAVDALEVKARAAELLGQHQQIKHFGARRRVFASVRFEPAPVVMGDGPGRCRRRPGPPRPTTRRRYRPRSPMPRTIPDPCRAATPTRRRPPVLSWDVQALFWMSFNAPAGPPERRWSAVAHLRRQVHRHAERLGATIEIDGVQHIAHRRPAPANFVLPWRRPAP